MNINFKLFNISNSKLQILYKVLSILRIILIIIFWIFILIYFLKQRGHIGYEDLIKSGFLKKKVFKIDKNHFFVIKKKYVNKYSKILLKNDNILYYPNLKKNVINIGDIIFHKTPTLGGKIINYFTNASFSHIGVMKYYIVDKENKLNYNVPEEYYLILPIAVGATKFPKRDKILTKLKNYPIAKLKLNEKGGSFVGDISLNLFVCENKDKLCIVRYKNFSDKNLQQFNEIISSYDFADYRFGAMLEFGPRTIRTNLLHFFQKIFGYNYYNTKKNYYQNLSRKITINKNKDKVSYEKLKGLKNTLKKLYLLKAISKDKKIKKGIQEKIKKLQIIINDIKNNKKFICSEFVYYIYYLIGIDLFRVDRFEVDPILFSNFVNPKDIEKVLVKDESFKYVCHFYN